MVVFVRKTEAGVSMRSPTEVGKTLKHHTKRRNQCVLLFDLILGYKMLSFERIELLLLIINVLVLRLFLNDSKTLEILIFHFLSLQNLFWYCFSVVVS